MRIEQAEGRAGKRPSSEGRKAEAGKVFRFGDLGLEAEAETLTLALSRWERGGEPSDPWGNTKGRRLLDKLIYIS